MLVYSYIYSLHFSFCSTPPNWTLNISADQGAWFQSPLQWRISGIATEVNRVSLHLWWCNREQRPASCVLRESSGKWGWSHLRKNTTKPSVVFNSDVAAKQSFGCSEISKGMCVGLLYVFWMSLQKRIKNLRTRYMQTTEEHSWNNHSKKEGVMHPHTHLGLNCGFATSPK